MYSIVIITEIISIIICYALIPVQKVLDQHGTDSLLPEEEIIKYNVSSKAKRYIISSKNTINFKY